jgi:hypothetical protein
MTTTNETMTNATTNELEIALKSRAEVVSILIKAINEGIETIEEYELLSDECGSLPDFDQEDPDESRDEISEIASYALDQYGLCLDGHAPDDAPSYFAWVLCTGGPHEEVRFYVNALKKTYSISFVYKDWGTFDEKILTRAEHAWAWEVAARFQDCFYMTEFDYD